MDERRRSERTPSRIKATMEAGGRAWPGTVINFSPEGALVQIEGSWDGDLVLRLDPATTWEGFTTEARLVRATPAGPNQTLVAVRF